jgi:hypothetical protein
LGVQKDAPWAFLLWTSKSLELTMDQMIGEFVLPWPVPKIGKASECEYEDSEIPRDVFSLNLACWRLVACIFVILGCIPRDRAMRLATDGMILSKQLMASLSKLISDFRDIRQISFFITLRRPRDPSYRHIGQD